MTYTVVTVIGQMVLGLGVALLLNRKMVARGMFRALYDPYYARYATFRPKFACVMRRYYDFVVRYMNVLNDRSLEMVEEQADGMPAPVVLNGISVSPRAERRGSFGAYHIQASWEANVITVSMKRVRGWLAWRHPTCHMSLHLPEGWVAS